MFMKNRGSVSLAMELLDTEEENSDEPAEAEVRLPSVFKYTSYTENFLDTPASVLAIDLQ